MDGTAFTQLAVRQENTGAIFPDFEGIPFLYVSLPHLTVADMEMSGYTIDINCGDKKR
jgi:hypothetical protein